MHCRTLSCYNKRAVCSAVKQDLQAANASSWTFYGQTRVTSNELSDEVHCHSLPVLVRHNSLGAAQGLVLLGARNSTLATCIRYGKPSYPPGHLCLISRLECQLRIAHHPYPVTVAVLQCPALNSPVTLCLTAALYLDFTVVLRHLIMRSRRLPATLDIKQYATPCPCIPVPFHFQIFMKREYNFQIPHAVHPKKIHSLPQYLPAVKSPLTPRAQPAWMAQHTLSYLFNWLTTWSARAPELQPKLQAQSPLLSKNLAAGTGPPHQPRKAPSLRGWEQQQPQPPAPASPSPAAAAAVPGTRRRTMHRAARSTSLRSSVSASPQGWPGCIVRQ